MNIQIKVTKKSARDDFVEQYYTYSKHKTAHETIVEERKRTQAETAKLEAYKKTVAQQMESAVRNAVLKKDDEIRNLKDRISWRNKMLEMFTKILMQSNGTFR